MVSTEKIKTRGVHGDRYTGRSMHIPGPDGQLEARFDSADNDTGHCAVLCHPHPQYGGSMTDGVLDVVACALRSSGVHCLRFNFRGVGSSDGVYDNGTGEVDDLLAAANWLQAERALQSLWLVGYSFGANVVWRALDRLGHAERVLLIAPPAGYMDFPERTPAAPVDVIVGDRDDFVQVEAVKRLPGARVTTIGGANHFFAGAWDELRTLVIEAAQRDST
jgi:alpha/beta superfamily hydrolase